jgi:hypothetical protein
MSLDIQQSAAGAAGARAPLLPAGELFELGPRTRTGRDGDLSAGAAAAAVAQYVQFLLWGGSQAGAQSAQHVGGAATLARGAQTTAVTFHATQAGSWAAAAAAMFGAVAVYELLAAAPTDLFLNGSEFCYGWTWPPVPQWQLWGPITGLRFGVVAPLALTAAVLATRRGRESRASRQPLPWSFAPSLVACLSVVFLAQLCIQYVADDQSVAMPHLWLILAMNMGAVPLGWRIGLAMAMSACWVAALTLESIFEPAGNPWPLSLACALHTLLFFPAEVTPALEREHAARLAHLRAAHITEVIAQRAAQQARYTSLLASAGVLPAAAAAAPQSWGAQAQPSLAEAVTGASATGKAAALFCQRRGGGEHPHLLATADVRLAGLSDFAADAPPDAVAALLTAFSEAMQGAAERCGVVHADGPTVGTAMLAAACCRTGGAATGADVGSSLKPLPLPLPGSVVASESGQACAQLVADTYSEVADELAPQLRERTGGRVTLAVSMTTGPGLPALVGGIRPQLVIVRSAGDRDGTAGVLTSPGR